ncbi:hypothetical protein OEV98_10885 [Caldibacillus lycopersici]|uniref:WYL domain-containing protein n=1 Tax=Perspicuibacillus lycopersici TaxID=1325689 RepID=A0AAE3LR09_9BACI|nr:hypothetical protein [Perspicuibacillus lycopersici]MCU9614064.1 hypothetical protein [Perspicuibacillus lycopersici]
MNSLFLRAIENGEKLEMIYQSDKGILTQRIIGVRKIGKEYIQAYCYTKHQIRTFKINNILSIAPIRHKRGA